YYTCLMMLCFYLLIKDKPEFAGATVAAAFLTKPQTAAFLPVLVFFAFLRYRPKRIAAIIAAGLFTTVLILLPFNLGRPVFWIFSHYAGMAAEYPYASFNAANFLALLSGNGLDDATRLGLFINYRFLGFGLFLLVCLFCGYYLYHHRRKAGLATVFAVVSFGFFLFFPRMHERYLFPFFAFFFLAFGYLRDRRLYFLGIVASLAYLLNLHVVVLRYAGSLPETTFIRAIYILAMVNTMVFAGLILLLFARLPGGESVASFVRRYKERLTADLSEDPGGKSFPLTRRDHLILGAALVLYGGFIFFRLGSTRTPMTGMSLWEKWEIVLSAPAEVSAVVLYDAEGTGEFSLEGYSGGTWVPLATVSTKDFYVQKRVSFPPRRLERLRLLPRPSAGRINELAFLGRQKELLPVESVLAPDGRRFPAGGFPLFDEQDRMQTRISHLNSTYFDEIYHGRTAYEFIRKTTVYETTHPPFGKDLIALGIALFGMNPFGMRFIPALLGVVLMGVLFFLGREVLACRFGAYAMMALGMLDFMPFVQSRYSTIDTPSVLLISLMFLFAFRFFRHWERSPEGKAPLKDTFFALFFFAMAAATKWTAVYGFAGAALIFLLAQFRRYRALKKMSPEKAVAPDKIVLSDLGITLSIFLLLVPALYYLTYIPFLRCAGITDLFSREAVATVVKSQQDMYAYHARLKATHPFSSPWWSWPFDFKPLWIYPDKPIDTAPGNRASIVSMGNPLIWWAGVLAVLLFFYRLLRLRRFSPMHLVFLGFLAQYLPWVLVDRITFMYHFYPVLPFYYLFIVAALRPLWEPGGKARRAVIGFFVCSLVLLLVFYPVLSGLEVPEGYTNALRWFPADWVF
ncbi:MAG: phospholipid carrier-dependent glycosyltransferase, partial [Firmicutes bacterium]|nr:phospholipid carrier-dependent glycosyltransferase [Bacillota bacterium]